MKQNTKRTRNYATIIYTESATDNWLEVLKQQHIPFFVSPLHDKDLKEDNSLKKPHYHIMILFDSVKTSSQAKEIFDLIGGVGVETINSPTSYARYLCHLDDKEKAQYNINDVISYGLDYSSYIVQKSDSIEIIKEMISYCRENYVRSYSELIEYAMLNREDWLRSLAFQTSYMMKEYIKSKYYNK